MTEQEIKKIVKKELYSFIEEKSIGVLEKFAIDLSIEETLKTINYTHSCTELCDKKEDYISKALKNGAIIGDDAYDAY